MANITIADLKPADSEMLFNAELSPQENAAVVGGLCLELDIRGILDMVSSRAKDIYKIRRVFSTDKSNEEPEKRQFLPSEECLNSPIGNFCL